MDRKDEICAFIIEGQPVCFNCYDPNTDREEDILSNGFIAGTDHHVCCRCNHIIRPERRVTNRRSNVDRGCRQEAIQGPDRRCEEDRRR